MVGNSEELIYSTGKRSLDTNGQATITVKSKATHDLKFDLSSYDGSQNLTLRITRTACTLTAKGLGDIKTEILPEHIVRTNPYLPKEAMIYGTVYWLSIDRQSPHLRYGKYYRFKALTILDFPLGNISTESLNKLTTVDRSPFISILFHSQWQQFCHQSYQPVSLRELDLAQVTTWTELPEACKNLYNSIAGPGITLNTAEFPNLSKVIHNSVTRESCWGREKLLDKCSKRENPKDIEFQSLRVSVRSSQGNSLGIPYVMEVWPPGHRSVIRDYGKACAVTRVLSGAVEFTWYDPLENGKEPSPLGTQCLLKKGQVIWLGGEQYHVRSLKNATNETCIILQCFQIKEDGQEPTYNEQFSYLGDGKLKIKLVPKSDCTLAEFYDLMERE
ncbi:hypothetical protein F4806DRAFT_505187 [Annulohypoxylon nitens]|nr:hypothetical protein F4806DRAFT_505187 [Annulohypoxylon nitens]